MKVLFCSFPEYGHWYPVMPLAEAMRDAGHEVTFATGAGVVPFMRDLGFAAEPAVTSFMEGCAEGVRRTSDPESVKTQSDLQTRVTEFLQSLSWPSSDVPEHPVDLGQLAQVAMTMRDMMADIQQNLTAVVEDVRPDLIVYEETLFPAAMVGALHGVPTVAHSIMTLGMPEVICAVYTKHCGELWAALRDDPLPISPYYGDLYLDTCPPGLGQRLVDPSVRSVQIRPVPWGKPRDEIPSWVVEPRTRPLVYVTMGTIGIADRDRLRLALDGVAELPVDILVVVGQDGDPASQAELPASVRVERFIRQDLLLPHIDVVVHHGGSGTMSGCLAYGVPQLMLPAMADQFQNADAVVKAGAGLALRRAELTSEAVADAVRKLLDDEAYSTGADFRQVINAMPGSAAVVSMLEAFVAERSAVPME